MTRDEIIALFNRREAAWEARDAASLPADAWSAAGYLLLGAAYAGVYLRTRSLPACIAANLLASATSFWLS